MRYLRVKMFTILFVMTLIFVEIFVRYLGYIDFPLYDIDNNMKYIVREHQHGVFMDVNDWYFNDKSMPIQTSFDNRYHPNILLIGNSIIMGGNAIKQNDKLTPLLQVELGARPQVWPAAIGGWTQINEMAYLDRHPEIVDNIDYFAWEYMAGGLSRATPWNGEYVFPRQRPLWATWYVLRRYVLPKLAPFLSESELPATGIGNSENIGSFDSHVGDLVRATHGRNAGLIWLYPTAAQLIDSRNHVEWLPERAAIKEIANKYKLKVIDLSNYAEWTTNLYRDGVHPTVEGNKILAHILYTEISKDFALSPRPG